MKLPLSLQSYEHPSQDANYQRCVNLFASPTGDEKSPFIQLHTSGLRELVDLTGSEVRALIPFDSKLYVIVDSNVYLVTLAVDKASATSSLIGTIAASSGRISWARNPTQVMIVDGSTRGYIITAATDTIAQITDPQFTGGVMVDFIDSYFLYNTPTASTMYSTAINDGTNVNALDVATAEGSPDKLLGLIAYRKEIWALGETSTEVWYDAANVTGFPFSLRDGAMLDFGTSAPHSACRANNSMLWLDDRRFVMMVSGYTPTIVSNSAISAKFQKYTTVNDAFAFAFKDRGHYFYQLTFPTEGKTWVYDLDNKLWHERSYRNPVSDQDTRHLANCYANFQGLNLVGAYNSGKIYIMSGDYLDDANDPIVRLSRTAHSTTELKQFTFHELVLHAETGKGTVTGTGSDPQITMRYSNDGGYSWSNHMARSIGALGKYGEVPSWNRLGSGRQWIFEFQYCEPTPLGLLELYGNVSGDGRA